MSRCFFEGVSKKPKVVRKEVPARITKNDVY